MNRVSRKKLLDEGFLQVEISETNQPVDAFRSALSRGRHELHLYHTAGSSAQDILSANTWLIDRILTIAWIFHIPQDFELTRSALIAVGGYGRGELHPHSDIDLLILFRSKPNSVERSFSESYIRFLWDIGLLVGHSVRSLRDCVTQARGDVTVLTNMMESRFLFGNSALSDELVTRIGSKNLWGVQKYFRAKSDEQLARHYRYNDTAFNLEPHIKEGPGGLRDIHTVIWIAQRYFGSRSLHTLVENGFLADHERRMLIRGRNLLWRIRNSLHFLSGRCEDRLLFDYQREIAVHFGYKNDKRSLAVEKLMKRYYRTVKELRFLNDLLLQYFHQEILNRNRKLVVDLNRRFRVVDGLIETKHSNVFKKQPFALLEIFALLQQRSDLRGIQANTIRQIWSSRHLVNTQFRNDIRCRSLFMEMLRAPSGQIHSLRRMNDYGILGAYIPVFGRIVGQMQHDLFHFFTVDAHLLFVVRNLRRLEIVDYNHELPFASSIMRSIFKRHRLFLAALFHDIAKGRGGNHSKLGEKEAYKFCRLHDLSDYDSKFVSWLVRHHLLMSWYAQKKDFSDPNVITDFARTVGNQERLDNLYLLTVADIRGTNPHVWNDWKGQLLMDLYIATSRALQRGVDAPIDLKEQIKDARMESANLLPPDRATIEAANRYWDSLESDYFLRYRPEIIAWHTQSLLSTPVTDLPLVTVRPQIEFETAQFLICSHDSDWFLSDVTAGFDQENINIIDARVHKARSGLLMMIFVVLMDSNILPDEDHLTASALRMRKQLLDPQPKNRIQRRRPATRMKHFPIATEISFHSAIDRRHTVMEVTAKDRPGLLHAVANALVHCKARLVNARVSTFGEKAEDVFLLQNRDGHEIQSKSQKDCLAKKIRSALP
jgi:[protein-PII] uridylyltransferase